MTVVGVSAARLTEEVIFRGFLLHGLTRRSGGRTAMFASSVLFAVYHVPRGIREDWSLRTARWSELYRALDVGGAWCVPRWSRVGSRRYRRAVHDGRLRLVSRRVHCRSRDEDRSGSIRPVGLLARIGLVVDEPLRLRVPVDDLVEGQFTR